MNEDQSKLHSIQLELAPELLPGQTAQRTCPPDQSVQLEFAPNLIDASAKHRRDTEREVRDRQERCEQRSESARRTRRIRTVRQSSLLMAALMVCALAYLGSRVASDQTNNVAKAVAQPVTNIISDDIIIDVVQAEGRSQVMALRNGVYEPIDYEYEYGQFISGENIDEYSDWQPSDIVLPEVEEIPEIARVEVTAEEGPAAFVINNGITVTVASLEDANWVNDKLFEPYNKPVTAAKLRDIGFDQTVQIVTLPEDVSITSKEEAYLLLKQRLKVVTTEEMVTDESVPFTTKYVDDASLSKGSQKIIQQGKNGSRSATYVITYMDGVESSKKLAAQTVHSEMVPQIVNRGTKGLANNSSMGYTEGKSGPNEGVQGKDKGSLSFDWPYASKVTSNFGPRWGRIHYGIDIAGPRGASLKASESGTVTKYWGTRGDYGLLVEIDHGNGFVTRYAHCEKLLVNPGDKVIKGQTVALMGDTGNASAVHIHFEIRVDGSPYNPRFYLNDGFKY